MDIKISKYIRIGRNTVWLNDEKVFSAEPEIPADSFFKILYRHYGIKYMKFFKMDRLSKLGYLASEILIGRENLTGSCPNEKIGVVLSNSNSTIDIDRQYYDQIKDPDNYFPSPALFVYTLPNIMIGEICIKNKFKGESTAFIMKEYDPGLTVDYINNLFLQNKVNICLAGFVDYAGDNNYDAFLYLADKREPVNRPEHSTEQINYLYYHRD